MRTLHVALLAAALLGSSFVPTVAAPQVHTLDPISGIATVPAQSGQPSHLGSPPVIYNCALFPAGPDRWDMVAGGYVGVANSVITKNPDGTFSICTGFVNFGTG